MFSSISLKMSVIVTCYCVLGYVSAEVTCWSSSTQDCCCLKLTDGKRWYELNLSAFESSNLPLNTFYLVWGMCVREVFILLSFLL